MFLLFHVLSLLLERTDSLYTSLFYPLLQVTHPFFLIRSHPQIHSYQHLLGMKVTNFFFFFILISCHLSLSTKCCVTCLVNLIPVWLSVYLYLALSFNGIFNLSDRGSQLQTVNDMRDEISLHDISQGLFEREEDRVTAKFIK